MLSRRRRWTSTTTIAPTVQYLDLTGLSILERLVLEEYVYQTQTQCNWILIGTHGLQSTLKESSPWSLASSFHHSSRDAAIVVGIGGKIPELLYTESVQEDQIPVIRRFSGGGTVLMNGDCIWTTLMGRDFPTRPFYPRPLMEYTATQFFHPLFTRLQSYQQRKQSKDSSAVNNLFSLREHDYVWNEDSKIAGNAQSIGKTGWLHHTSFLWQIPSGMSRYLRLPAKRPDYRASRPHEDFVRALSDIFPELTVDDFRRAFRETSEAVYSVESSCVLSELQEGQRLPIVLPEGGLRQWYQTKSRTKVITQF
ncbi:hypothetical protein FisN_11Hh306 [Fistulifera solaris]|uniref:BPL/LPL catalytic domain-containing protein n=1 Tax=Fistulifera solaris TaxID=1519565 RepID=A0A1Z5JFW5_FISSO|nr:hypothetical protein FisN_11Hh306 [Fistulifera solaris]|eukprot:GAX12895.1 hypothetical protein FisN_11Hh306 [Fistulifera solaris]